MDGVGGVSDLHSRLAERRRRMAIVNLLLQGSGVGLSQQGRQLIVRSATGSTRLVTDLAHVWRAADELGRQPIDPLSGSQLPLRRAAPK